MASASVRQLKELKSLEPMATHNSLGYFDPAFDSGAFVEPKFRYAIFSSQRTGSNYLCARLSNAKDRYGIPMEYLHPDAIRLMGARLFPGVAGAISLECYLDAVAKVRATADGWFGTKIQPDQLLPLVGGNLNSAIGFLGSFDRLILLTRRDKLGQAISGAIAYATGVWFNFGAEPMLDGVDLARFFPLISRLRVQYESEEKLIGAICGRLTSRPLLHICYEDILASSEDAFQRVVTFLDPESVAVVEEEISRPPTRKPPGALAEQIRAAYLAHQATKR